LLEAFIPLDKTSELCTMFPHMYDTTTLSGQLRLQVAKYYVESGLSQKQTAERFKVHYNSVWKWVRLYKKEGAERLLSTYRRPWNRADLDLEAKIALMKEHEPALTVRKARELLEKEGISISPKGVWAIWKRYGYAGFNQKNMASNFTDCSWTKEAKDKYGEAQQLFEQGGIDRSAEILNSIPALPENELLPQIPAPMLNLRRRVEQVGLVFGKIPLDTYLRDVRSLHNECCSLKLYYSTLIVGLVETMALSWSNEPIEMLQKTSELRNILTKSGCYYSYLLSTPSLMLLILEGIAYAKLLETSRASKAARTCRILLKRRKYISPIFMRHYGQLCTQLDDFRQAEHWYSKSLDELEGEEKEMAQSLLAGVFAATGEYEKARHTRREEHLNFWGSFAVMLRSKSIWALTRGNPHKAISLAVEALALLEKEKVRASMFGCYLAIASAYASLGENLRAQRTLKKILPFLTANRLYDVKAITEILVSCAPHGRCFESPYEQSLPTIKLTLLLSKKRYAQALKYAERKGIKGWLHRYIFFFPEAVTPLLEKGKPTGLPRAMLNLPVFRKEIPVYSVRFLGNLAVYKNQKYLRVKLAPQDTAFLIHLAAAKRRYLALDRIYNNFWPESKNPARNLAHLLVRLRKALCLPSHFLYVRDARLYFDCHFITDYGEYLEHLAQAKAFAVAGEWAFARTEYLHAFSLFRDAPFNKMYDNWSEDLRRTILGRLETDAVQFVQTCAENGDRDTGPAALRKISKIIPLLDETANLSNNLMAIES
jgi:transposase